MPKSGLSGSVRGAPSNGRPYRDTSSLEKDDVQADPTTLRRPRVSPPSH
jgi:hypothetical protein